MFSVLIEIKVPNQYAKCKNNIVYLHEFHTKEKTFSSKCRPAVGAAVEPISLEYIVWYLFLSLSVGFLLIYGGNGVLPYESKSSYTVVIRPYDKNHQFFFFQQ
ncbi:MAG: hypothetical protein CM15mP93_16700 [Thiotrichaceae bacterium]|nr:MAG: hypothetical protein CM15mP93_16700 [Thiotrichaceae bacterium]